MATHKKTSKLAKKLTELTWKLWQTCNTQAPPTCVQFFRNYGFGLPQAHKRDKQDVLHVSWLYASEQKDTIEVAYVCMVISCKQVFTSKLPSCTHARCIYFFCSVGYNVREFNPQPGAHDPLGLYRVRWEGCHNGLVLMLFMAACMAVYSWQLLLVTIAFN